MKPSLHFADLPLLLFVHFVVPQYYEAGPRRSLLGLMDLGKLCPGKSGSSPGFMLAVVSMTLLR
jgi:hypothetical protein